MPRPRLPPTPLSSTDIVGKDQQNREMESVFALPPPAIQSVGAKSLTSKTHSQMTSNGQNSPPLTPIEKTSSPSVQRKRTLSGTAKSKIESPSSVAQSLDSTLPPPPSRARKIIQMKPKQKPKTGSDQQAQSSVRSATSQKEPATNGTPKRKQTQPSTSSAAGRKIARKTAHSIIERRRRSKMNEEFGVLKDMIPACAGVEMHKLAILQAGIEYVKYLEGCIEQLKAQNEATRSKRSTREDEVDDDNDDDGDENDDESMDVDRDSQRNCRLPTVSSTAVSESETSSPSIITRFPAIQNQKPLPSFRKLSTATSTANSTLPSPDLRPVQSSSSLSTHTYHTSHYPMQPPTSIHFTQSTYSTTPPPLPVQTPLQTGVSPAFGAIKFSPDLSRTSTWSAMNGASMQNKPPPSMIPLPQAAIPLPPLSSTIPYGNDSAHHGSPATPVSEGQAEATATAALLMMTKDRRGSVSMTRTSSGKGMSVRDLLSS